MAAATDQWPRFAGMPMAHAGAAAKQGGASLEINRALDSFLAGVERRALRMATISTGNRDDALDIVQDAMMKLATRYANHSPDQWAPLFYRILHNGITGWHRRRGLRQRWLHWLGHDDDEDPIDRQPDVHGHHPDHQLQEDQAMQRLEQALRQLPLRQQQAFMLRLWEGLDVAATAKAMGCSSGSVKTHYSRAIHSLRDKLEGSWP